MGNEGRERGEREGDGVVHACYIRNEGNKG